MNDNDRLMINGDRHSKFRPALCCRVLPPGEFNGMIPEPLTVNSESFMTTAVGLTFYRNAAKLRNYRKQYVEGIYSNSVTLKSRLEVTQGHWKWQWHQ